MAIYNHSYSGLVTKGLGGPACCGMLTLHFSLFFCKIDIIVPPITPTKSVGGGWSRYQVRNIPGVPKGSAYYTPANRGSGAPKGPAYYTPVTRGYGEQKRIMAITLNLGYKKWEKTYVVGANAANIAVKVLNVFQATANNVKVAVTSIQQAVDKATDAIKPDDK